MKRKNEIIKYLNKKYGIEITIQYNGWTIHKAEKTRWWVVDIPCTDSYDNEKIKWHIPVYSLDEAWNETERFIELYYDNDKKICII